LSETSTYLNESFQSIGLTPGVYVYSFYARYGPDTFTVDVGVAGPRAVPEPSTWAMVLIGLASLGYAAVRRKAAIRAISS
jgi:hypothetical protein